MTALATFAGFRFSTAHILPCLPKRERGDTDPERGASFAKL